MMLAPTARFLSQLTVDPCSTNLPRWLGLGVLKRFILASVVLICGLTALAAEAPQPPCGSPSAYPLFAEQGAPPNIRVWRSSDLGNRWIPPACTGWAPKAGLLVALAGEFRFEGSAEGLLARFGAISTLSGILYWSVSDHQWRHLVTRASALDSPDLTRQRPDFTAAEMKRAHDLYFAHDDTRASGKVIHRLRVIELTPNRLVVATENVSPVRKLMLTLADPGGLQTVHFLEHQSPNVWGYYVLARTAEDITSLLGVTERSYVNRAVALYRHFIGIPTDRDPPLAP
jgi:hypothetical protein